MSGLWGVLGCGTGRAACIISGMPGISDSPHQTMWAAALEELIQVMGGLFRHIVSLLVSVSVQAAYIGFVLWQRALSFDPTA